MILLAVILFGLGVLQWYPSKNAKKIANLFAIVGIGLFLAGAFLTVPQADFLTNPIQDLFEGDGLAVVPVGTPTLAPTPGAPVTKSGQCLGVEDTTVTLSAVNFFTDAGTGGTHKYRINDNPALTVANAGSFTASPGDLVDTLFMNGSETDNEYYSDVVLDYQVPCVGTATISKKLYSNSSVTIDVFNEEGNLINSLANNETLAAGDVVTLQMKLRGVFQRGHPFEGIVVAEYSIPSYDDVQIDFNGVQQVPVPTFHRLGNGSQTAKAYKVPAIIGTDIPLGKLIIDTDDTRQPTAVPFDVVNLTYYPQGYFIDDKVGGVWKIGAEDEESTQTKKYSVNYAVAVI